MRVVHVLHLLYPCPQPEKKSKKGKEKAKKQKEKQKEKEQTKKKKKEGKEKKTRGQTPKKKKGESADDGDEGEEEEDEEDDEIVLLGKKQARVVSAKAEVARMTSAPRQVRSTLLERDDPMSPDSGKGRSRSGSGSESSSSSSSSTSTSGSSGSKSSDTEEDEPSKLAKTKSALRTVKSEEVAARPKKPHFFVETSGRPPRLLPTRATRQEKHKSSDAHQRSLQILEEFLQEYDSNLGQLVHHYKECCKKKDHPAEGVYAPRVIGAVSCHVPGRPDVRRACSARFACCL